MLIYTGLFFDGLIYPMFEVFLQWVSLNPTGEFDTIKHNIFGYDY